MPIVPTSEQKDIQERNLRVRETQARAAELVARHPFSDEQVEGMAFQAEANAHAERFPLFAAARATAVHHLVVPLALGTTEPIVDPSDASSDPRTLLEWWRATPDANVGVVVGRVSNLIALHIADAAAVEALRKFARIEWHNDDDKRGYEYREINGASVVFRRPYSPPKSQAVWGKRGLIEQAREQWEAIRATSTGEFYLTWSYAPIQSNMDAYDFRHRKVGPGLTVLGDGDVIPWAGRLQDGLSIDGPMRPSPEIPLWLGKTLGKPRSRRAMQAQREQWEADLRVSNAHLIGALAAQRAAEQEARAKAIEDREKAEAALIEAMRKEQ